MEYKEMLDRAREKYNGSCKVCRVCDGVACRGQVPGMGGKGTGKAFIENVEALDRIKLNMRVIHKVAEPDMSIDLFGKKLDLPVMAAPITGTILNMGGLVTEKYLGVYSIFWGNLFSNCMAAFIFFSKNYKNISK